MKRHSSSAFSTAILAMAVAAAGLFAAQQAQAQTVHYGPDGGRECWATPFAGGYHMEINAPGESWDGETHYCGDFTIVNTVGDKTYVQGSVIATSGGDQRPYNFQSTSYLTPTEFFYYATWDNGGLQSESKTLYNDNPPPANNPPTVSITAPSGGATYMAPATVNITASASDTDGTITKVEFYQGATKLGEDTSSSGGWTYSWTGVAAGSYSLTAKAFDNGGASTISAAVGITVNAPAAPTIANAAVSGVTAGSATLNGNLTSTGTASTTVYVYWGAVDRGQTTTGWDGSQNLGVRSPGAVSHPVSGLSGGSTYHYRFFAQNSVGSDWGDPATQFETASAPTVDNAAADNIGAAGARLNGALMQGGSATATVYWGPTDGGTTPGSWSNSVLLGTVSEGALWTDISGLNETTTYYFRFYVENAYGTDWADSTASFATPAKQFSDWNCKMQITFGGYSKSSTLADFPVLVVLNQGLTGFQYGQFQTAGGGDLRFTDSNDVELSYQIEEWNPAGNSYVWVQVPQLVDSSSCIWAYWGKAGATAPGYTTDGSTWANGFVGVWHLNEDGTGARLDSSPNNNDGVPCAYSGVEATVGLIGGADNLDGITNCIRIPNNAGMQLNERLSLSAWVKADIWDTVNENVIIRKSSGYRFLCRDTGFMTLKLESAPDVLVQDPIANYSVGAWYHLVATYDKDANIASLYTNGVLAASTSGNTSLLSNDTDDPYIGSSDGAGQFFNGIIDEARICNVARSADWVWACYENQKAGSTFCSYATVQGGSITDNDGDGLDDDWENTYLGGTNASSGTAGEDYDGDGFCDLFEFYAGTDPTNAASLLKVVQVSPDSASNFVLDWASVAGKVYSVEWIADMTTPPWATVASNIAATPPLNVHTISVTGVESGFYRVDVQH